MILRLSLVVLLVMAVAALALATLALPPPEEFHRSHVFQLASV